MGGSSRDARCRSGAAMHLVFGTMAALTVAVVVIAIFAKRPRNVTPLPLPVFAAVPDFTLIERSGQKVSLADLRGKVWVADFVFTQCAGPCPELSLRMRSLQQDLPFGADRVRLVSFSLDPKTDTPAVLAKYAARYHADPDRWLFLTCDDEEAMHRLVKEGFLQAVTRGEKSEEPIVHSTYFVLVDGQGRMRGFYEGLNPETKVRVLEDIRALVNEGQSN